MNKKKIILNATLLISLISITSCGQKNKVTFIEGTPITEYKRGDFFSLEGLKFNKEIKSITIDGNPFIEGQVIRNIGTNIPVALRSTDDFLYEYKINISENLINQDFKDFTFYELGKNGELHTSPTIGESKMLVIPVIIKGFESTATKETLTRIEKAFNGEEGEVEFESVKSFYKKSSFNKLNFDITVTDQWFDLGMTPSQIHQERDRNDPSGMGYVVDKAVEWYKKTYNSTCEEFDSDKDGFVDNVWIIYSSPNSHNYAYPSSYASTYWAATTRNFGNYNKANIKSPLGYNFALASYDFMDIGYGKEKIDTHTYIHETGHLLGLLDYYSYDGTDQASGAIDMMDLNIGDHCALSKYSLGWIDPIVIDKTTTIRLEPFEKSGDFILIGGEGFSGSAFDEYFTVEYITPTGLNEKDYLETYEGTFSVQGYSKPGIRINHCDNRGSDGKSWIENPSEIAINYVSNTPSESRYFNNKLDKSSAMYNYTIMNKNYVKDSKYDPLNYDYIPSDDALFFENEEFDFTLNTKYNSLMPSKSNKLNKYKDEKEEFNILDFKVEVKSLTPEYAELLVTIN